MLGTLILWFGWYGFNGGSALLSNSPHADRTVALAATNTTLAGGTAGLVALMVNLWYLERYTGEAYFDLKYAMNGSLAGLVAITGGCGVVEPWAAVVIGTVAGNLYLVGSKLLVRLRLDDACDAIPVHGMCGCWGLIGVGLFASPTRLMNTYGRFNHPGLVYSWQDGNSDATLLGAQLAGILFIFGWVMCIMLPFFIWLDWKGWFRSDPLEEIVGLDTSYHGGLALLSNHGDDSVHPEFISSYKKQRSENNTLRKRQQMTVSKRSGTTATSSDKNDENDDDYDDEEYTANVDKVHL
jgi:ammonium transporter, Amt family